MGSPTSKPQVDLEEIIFQNTVRRGVDLAQTQIVRVLGRRPPFQRVRLGVTDVDLGKTARIRKDCTITSVFTSPNAKAVAEIRRVLAAWLAACHGARYDDGAAAPPPVKSGSTTLYIAVAYPAGVAPPPPA